VESKTTGKLRLFFLLFKIVLTLSCSLLNFSVLSLTFILVPANYICFSFSPRKHIFWRKILTFFTPTTFLYCICCTSWMTVRWVYKIIFVIFSNTVLWSSCPTGDWPEYTKTDQLHNWNPSFCVALSVKIFQAENEQCFNPNPGGLVANMTSKAQNCCDKFIIHKKNCTKFVILH